MLKIADSEVFPLTRNSIRWEFACSQHDVPEVERGVVDTTELLVWMVSSLVVLEGGLYPPQGGQVPAGQHIDVGMLTRLGLLTQS